MTIDITESLSHPLRVACACNHTDTYADVDAYAHAGGTIVYHNQTDLFAATCPACHEPRPVRAGTVNWDDGPETCLALGAFEAGYAPLDETLDGEYDLGRTEFTGVLDPVHIAREHLDPTCPYCDARITDDHRQEDSDAPHIGYVYYCCPRCGHKMRTETIDDQRDE